MRIFVHGGFGFAVASNGCSDVGNAGRLLTHRPQVCSSVVINSFILKMKEGFRGLAATRTGSRGAKAVDVVCSNGLDRTARPLTEKHINI